MKHKRREQEEEELLEIEREEMLGQVPIPIFDKSTFWNIFPSIDQLCHLEGEQSSEGNG